MIDEKKLVEELHYYRDDVALLGDNEEYLPITKVIELINRQQKIKCSDCSRRKFYQQGYEDGLKADKFPMPEPYKRENSSEE